MSGYESQQAFTDVFKAMYKTSPAEFQGTEKFYPLQLEIHLKKELIKMDLTKDNIKFATFADVNDWMELVRLTIDGYPCMDNDDYIVNLYQYIVDKKALILRDDDMAIGVMGFSFDTGNIDFLAVHPQYRHMETVVILSHKKTDSVINVKVEFGEGEGKVPLDNIAKRAAAYKPKERVTYKMIKEYIEV